jgi:hypothetical protein
MSSKLALRVATLAIGTAAFAAVPALAQNQNPQMESKRQAAAERNHLRGVEKWDHGKKYYDDATGNGEQTAGRRRKKPPTRH